MVRRTRAGYRRAMTLVLERPAAATGAGELLRAWRQRRRLSQLELACQADVSTRHLSCVETGRSRPSRQLVLHLCEHLDVPLRGRNDLLVAAGHAPVYGVTDLAGFSASVLARLTVEQFFPADAATDAAVRAAAAAR
jgi:transcriptional regulator with XRE-family HTH domain